MFQQEGFNNLLPCYVNVFIARLVYYVNKKLECWFRVCFALCYGSGFQTMGTVPFIRVHEQSCAIGETGRLLQEKRDIEIKNSSFSCYKRHIFVSGFNLKKHKNLLF